MCEGGGTIKRGWIQLIGIRGAVHISNSGLRPQIIIWICMILSLSNMIQNILQKVKTIASE